jgi:hypothetical protein
MNIGERRFYEDSRQMPVVVDKFPPVPSGALQLLALLFQHSRIDFPT